MSGDSLQDTNKAVVTTVTAEPVIVKRKIYLGPNIPREGLNRFRIYIDGIPEHITTLVTACPSIGKLFVDVDTMTSVLNQIDKTGTSYHIWYHDAEKYAKGV